MTVDNRTHDAVIHSGDQDPSGHNRFLPRIAALALAGLVGGGVVAGADRILNRGEDRAPAVAANQPNTQPTPNTPQPIDITPTSTPLPSAEVTKSPEKSPHVGNIDIKRIYPGEEVITHTLPNGKVIKVPAQARTGSDNERAEVLIAQVTAYLTTGEEEFLNALTKYVPLKDGLRKQRQEWVKPVQAAGASTGSINPLDTQVMAFDPPSDPAEFTHHTDEFNREVLELSEGTLYFDLAVDPFDTNEWQPESVRSIGALASTTKTIRFFFGPSGDLVRFEWEPEPTYKSN